MGRYVIGDSFASGGMGTVHLARVRGAEGFSRVVAAKKLFPHLARDAAFRQMLLDEARLVSRIRHPNVVTTLDLVEDGDELLVVMEYIHGVSLARVLARCRRGLAMPVTVAAGIVEGVLSGLHAAHEARGEAGNPLGIVHRDVSPQNVLVGADGVARLIDFGIAKAALQLHATEPGVVKGKTGYMAPEQLQRVHVTRRSDLFAAGVVLWEAIANRRLVDERDAEALSRWVALTHVDPPGKMRGEIDSGLDAVVLRALAREPGARFPTAEAMGTALREACPTASSVETAKWLQTVAVDDLELSDERVRLFEQTSIDPTASSRASSAPRSDAYPASIVTVPQGPFAPKRRGRRIALVAGAAATGLAAFAWSSFVRHPNTIRPGIASGNEVAPGSPSPRAAAPPETIGATIPLPSSSAAPAAGSASSSGVPGAVPAPSRPSPRVPSAAGHADCDPPFSVDASGRKHYYPNCF
jgi:serine/threonine-protein kinase